MFGDYRPFIKIAKRFLLHTFMVKISSHLDRLLGRLEDLDSVNLTILAKRLGRERHLLETVFNTIKEGVVVVNAYGIVEYANAAAFQLIGLRIEDIGETPLWKLIPSLRDDFESIGSETKVSAKSQELEITYPERRIVHLYKVAVDLGTEEQEEFLAQKHYALIFSDVTEQYVSTQELIENEKLSSIFMLAAGVAHEIGNPLNSINIHLQVIKRQLEKLKGSHNTVEKLEDSVEASIAEVQRLDGIIRHFLNALRPMPLNLEELNLYQVLAEVLSFLKEELENLEIKVVLEFDKELPIVMGDTNQIKQVFFNVLKNAMEAMDAGGVIKVAFRFDDDDVYIDFQDTGVGISQEDLAHVFEPYFSKKEKGSGLGLMIVQRILREHGGSISLQSQEGRGTLATLKFPQKHRRIRTLTTNQKPALES